MPKILKDIKINFISLVRKGANNRTVIFKSADAPDGGGEELRQVQALKKDDVKQMIYGIVYAPDETDAHGHTANAVEIERAAYGFMKALKAQNVDKSHSNTPDGGAYVAESWIVREGDPLFKEEKPGAWAVGIKCEDPELYKEAMENLPAISMAGTATIITKADEGDADAVGLFRKIINLLKDVKPETKEVPEMDEMKIQELINAAITKAVPEMDEKQIKELINAAITKEAETPPAGLADITGLTTKMSENLTLLTERLEKIEKQTPGTKQDQADTAELIKEQEELGARIAKIANR